MLSRCRIPGVFRSSQVANRNAKPFRLIDLNDRAFLFIKRALQFEPFLPSFLLTNLGTFSPSGELQFVQSLRQTLQSNPPNQLNQPAARLDFVWQALL